MNAPLEDLRLLRLAAMYEEAFEAFVVRTAEEYLDDATIERLAPLRPEKDQHEQRIRMLLERIESSIPKDERRPLARAALVDIVDVERAAREFYFNHLDRVHDPEVVRLFHELAHEETRHVEIAENALAILGPEERPDPSLGSAEIPRWEGVSDLDRREARNERRTP